MDFHRQPPDAAPATTPFPEPGGPDSFRSGERRAFVALVTLLLAPVIAQGLWLPLVHFLGASGNASGVTLSALVQSVVILAGLTLPTRYFGPAGSLKRFPAVVGLLSLSLSAALSLALALGMPGFCTLGAVAGCVHFLCWYLPPRLPVALDGLARSHRMLTPLYGVVALLAIFSTARMSVFMGDPTRVDLQAIPGQKFLETHSCLTAYVHGAALSRQGVENLYADHWWVGFPGMDPGDPAGERPYGPFTLDYYAYPPPFLLVMAPLIPLEGDFPAQRALWFGFNGTLLAASLWIVSRWIHGPGAHRPLLLAPLFFGSLAILVTLQIGNFQIAAVVVSVLAMVAFHQGRSALGGALLAAAILSKISPGVLGIVLLARKQWKDAAWTTGFGALFLVLSLLTVGTDPLTSFLTFTLPRLSSGETFSFMDDDPFSIFTNMAPFGIPFKLQVLGVDVGDPWVFGRWLGRVHTAVLVFLAVFAVRRPVDRRTQALTWMSLLVLAGLQSPFAPGYVVVGLLWALTLLSMQVSSIRDGMLLAGVFVLSTAVLPLPPGPNAVLSLIQGATVLAMPVWMLITNLGRAPEEESTLAKGPAPA